MSEYVKKLEDAKEEFKMMKEYGNRLFLLYYKDNPDSLHKTLANLGLYLELVASHGFTITLFTSDYETTLKNFPQEKIKLFEQLIINKVKADLDHCNAIYAEIEMFLNDAKQETEKLYKQVVKKLLD